MKCAYEECQELVNKPAGFKITIDGVVWIKMESNSSSYINGAYFNTDTGSWVHASCLFDLK